MVATRTTMGSAATRATTTPCIYSPGWRSDGRGSAVVEPRRAGLHLDHRDQQIERGRGDAVPAREVEGNAVERVDLHRAAGFQVLEDAGAMRELGVGGDHTVD